MKALQAIRSAKASELGQRLTRDLELPVEPWWLLWVLALSVTWLVPTHLLPWRSYHAEMAMVLALLPAAWWAMLSRPAAVQWPRCVLLLLCVSLVPLLQLWSGRIHFSGDAWISAGYLVGVAMTILVGARIESRHSEQGTRALFAGIGLAAMASTGLVLYQLLHVQGLGMLTIEFPYGAGYRPFANFGQPNHLATLLVWGVLVFWWLFLTDRVRGAVAVAAIALLLIAVAATQSRTAWLELFVVGAAAVLLRGPLSLRRSLPGLVTLAVVFGILILGWAEVTTWLEFGPARRIEEELSSARLRPAAWELFFDAVLRRPWAGWGWNQIPVAQSAVALDHPSLRYTFLSTHNVVLDLFVQTGIPVTLVLVCGALIWFVGRLRRVANHTQAILLVALAVLAAHAMVEFPLTYTYFLLPAGLMVGALDASIHRGKRLQSGRAFPLLLLAGASAMTVWVAVEYRLAERSLEQVRMERNRVGFARGSVAPDLILLTQLREFLWYLRIRPTQPATPEQLEAMRRVVEQYPSDGNHLVYAIASATSGRPELAAETLARMCRMVPPSRCEAATASWRAMAKGSKALEAVSLRP